MNIVLATGCSIRWRSETVWSTWSVRPILPEGSRRRSVPRGVLCCTYRCVCLETLLPLTDVLVADSPSSDNIVLLTDSRLLSFRSRKLRLEWDLPLRAIHHVTVQDDGIKFYTKSEHETEHFVHISEEATLTWFFDEISSIVKRYNARRKLGSAGRTQR